MRPLTLDDLLPLREYAGRRREFFDAFGKYLDRYRRVRVGPRVTLLFENRQTLWFRVHEIIRIARLADAERLQEELDWYNTLLPGRHKLQAAMLINVEDETKLTEELALWQGFTGDQLRLQVGAFSLPATLVTCRPEDLCIGAAHWMQFAFDSLAREQLTDFSKASYLEITLPDYHYRSDLLGDEIRQSLLEDLELSDRDAAQAG